LILYPCSYFFVAEGLNVMIKVSVEANLFRGSIVGDKSNPHVRISQLRFADDTLIMGEKSWANISAIKALLILFELVLGLKFNFQKNMLVGVNVDDFWLLDASLVVNCKIDHIAFMYIGLSIGGNPHRCSMCLPVINSIQKRLFGWKSRHLSMGIV
jgi:hypothetical protein